MRRPPAIALLLLLSTAPTDAQSQTNWSPIRQVALGSQVRAIVDSGVTHLGTFETADDDSLTLQINHSTQRVFRASVREVSVARTSRKKNVWWGLAIGAAASFAAVGIKCAGESEGCNESAPAWFYPMAGAGAAVGALMPPRTVWREVYVRAP